MSQATIAPPLEMQLAYDAAVEFTASHLRLASHVEQELQTYIGGCVVCSLSSADRTQFINALYAERELYAAKACGLAVALHPTSLVLTACTLVVTHLDAVCARDYSVQPTLSLTPTEQRTLFHELVQTVSFLQFSLYSLAGTLDALAQDLRILRWTGDAIDAIAECGPILTEYGDRLHRATQRNLGQSSSDIPATLAEMLLSAAALSTLTSVVYTHLFNSRPPT